MRYLLFCFLYFATMANSSLIVPLSTQVKLVPVYLAQITGQNTEFNEEYLDKLSAVLRYDFENNGTTQLSPLSKERELFAAATYLHPRENLEGWRQAKVLFVIIPKMQANHLTVRVFTVSDGSSREISDITLSGELQEDRRRIHHAADSIHLALFGKEGVASTKILFTRRLKDRSGQMQSEVWQSDYDGANAHQVTQEEAYVITPSYIPPAQGKAVSQFLYVTYRWGQPKIMYASLKNGQGVRLSSLRGNQLLPAISPKRDQVAFISDITGNPDLFLQPFTPENGPIGKPQQIFSSPRAVQGSPTFNPAGTKLAFVSNKAGRPQIYVMDLPKPGSRRIKPMVISTRARNGSAPTWSPDGTKIAFTAISEQVRQIWIYDFTTKEERQITEGKNHKENPSWAPDSSHIIYNTSDIGSAELYIIDLKRLQPCKISLGEGEKRFPSWEPRSKNSL